jgi:Tol biopolymer transport system component
LRIERHADAQGDFESPSWTPDGDYVLVSRKQANTLHEVWMYNIQCGSGVQVTKSSPTATTPPQQRLRALGAVASTDGKYFHFARRTGNFSYNTTFPIWQSCAATASLATKTSSPAPRARPSALSFSPMERSSSSAHARRPKPACACAISPPARKNG